MGQMYLPSFFDKNADIGARNWEPLEFQLSPLDFGCGCHLNEHYYVKNKLMQAVEYMLAKDEDSVRFVWAGEYTENFRGLLVNLFTWERMKNFTKKVLDNSFPMMPFSANRFLTKCVII